MIKQNGLSIVFEGLDGSGKTGQVKRLERRLENIGRETFIVKEPYGPSKGGDSFLDVLSSLLMNEQYDYSTLTELLLFSTARSFIMEHFIIPGLERGYDIISDRSILSTFVYQKVRSENLETAETLDLFLSLYAIHSWPIISIAFLLDVDVEESLKRLKQQKDHSFDRFEQMSKSSLEEVAKEYRSLFLSSLGKDAEWKNWDSIDIVDKWCIVNSNNDIDRVEEDIWEEIKCLL